VVDLGELDAELAPDLEARRAAHAAKAAAWRSSLGGPLGEAKAKFHDARARTAGYAVRVAKCCAKGRACEHCGLVILRRCGATMVCESCSSHRWGKHRRKLARALAGHLGSRVQAWRRRGRPAYEEPRLALLTLTLRHSGDAVADRELLSLAWHRWRAWYREKYGESLPYAWAPEYTPGRDDLGHVHMHVTTVLPWRDFDELRAAWRRATGAQGERIHVSVKTRGVRDAARYLAKYATKGVKGLNVRHAAAWLRAQYGKRSMSKSRNFDAPDPPSKHGPWSDWTNLASVEKGCYLSPPDAMEGQRLVTSSGLHPSARDGPVPF
jgi:hypothetical protein